jgi:flagellum-specific peptidoglycan hydrolase FlgJ
MYRDALINSRKYLEQDIPQEQPSSRSLVAPRRPELQEKQYDPVDFLRRGMQRIREAARAVPEEFEIPTPTPKQSQDLETFSREEFPDMVEEVTEEGVEVTHNAAHYGLVSRPPSRSSTPTGNRKEFVSMLMPHAIEASKKTGLDPRLIIAQAAQETGWGKSAPNNNYFGIKSHGKAGGSTQRTHEYVDGKRVSISDSFRGYESPADSVKGYADFLMSNPRYSRMLSASTLEDQASALGESGYATDPNYARSVLSIARSIELPKGS